MENNVIINKDELAKEFLKYKNNSLRCILEMGNVLVKAKNQLDKGEFHNWLRDSRVNISIRTSQRFMDIYRNFRHLLKNDSSELLTDLDISHLLELKNVPQRFKKSIEIEEQNGEKSFYDVVDEDKVKDFLNKQVTINNKIKKVKELPLKEFKRQIQEVGGEYKDIQEQQETKSETFKSEPVSTINGKDSPEPIKIEKTKKSGYGVLFEAIPYLISLNEDLIKKLDKIDEVTLFEMDSNDKVKLKSELDKLKNNLTALVVKIDDKGDIL